MATILLVEDEDGLRHIFTLALERAGFQVYAASNGTEALAYLARTSPDLVVTDLSMPEVTGADLVQQMARDSGLARVPIVLMSGVSDSSVPSGYPLLEKPFGLQDLVRVVQHLLGDAA